MRRRAGGLGAGVLSAGIVAYQWTLRPFIGAHCRYEPSCSHYALEALAAHGATRGSLLTVRRVLRCNPWTPGGYDPVPPVPVPPGDSRAHGLRPDQAGADPAMTGAPLAPLPEGTRSDMPAGMPMDHRKAH